MEEVSPYSVDVVFLAQLVIITIYSPCSAVKSTIRNATIRALQTLTHIHTCTHTQVYTNSAHACRQQQKKMIATKECSTISFYAQAIQNTISSEKLMAAT